jgi:uncharacterized repeat protein (TIGR01451 family)
MFTVFNYWAKKCLCVFLGVLALTIPFSQIVGASSPPVLNVSGSATYFVGGGPVLVAPGLILTGDDINKVLVSITANFTSGDYLGIQGMPGTSGSLSSGIDWSYDTLTGVMDLHNPVAASVYQSVLRQITYYSTSGVLSSRTIVFSVVSDLYCASTGHFYEYVASSGISWENARTAAAGRSYCGRQGYLATVTSQAENGFILTKLGGNAWMGASDSGNESYWRWVTGPEGAANSGNGTYFFKQTAAASNSVNRYTAYSGNVGSGGYAIAGLYNNWNNGQPDDYCDYDSVSEDYAHFYYNYYPNSNIDGTWNDYPNDNGYGSGIVKGYVVEYGGLPGDTDYVTVNVELSADVSIAKLGLPDPVPAGGHLTYTLTVTNSGPSTASNVVVTETYPAGFTYSSANPGPDTGTNNQWTFSSISANASQTININGTVTTTPGSLTNTARVTSSTDDPNPINNAASQNSTVYVPMGVGGEVIPVSRPAMLIPWLVVIGILMIGGTILVLNHRKGS